MALTSVQELQSHFPEEKKIISLAINKLYLIDLSSQKSTLTFYKKISQELLFHNMESSKEVKKRPSINDILKVEFHHREWH